MFIILNFLISCPKAEELMPLHNQQTALVQKRERISLFQLMDGEMILYFNTFAADLMPAFNL
jgi:hypothetical protein